jgi:para-nitrobenzyl esterase
VRAEEGAAARPVAIGAPHACEIEYAMGNLDLVTDYAWTADDYKVSETMQSFFANFILTGNPNGDALPEWHELDSKKEGPQVMVIDVESASKTAKDDVRFGVHDTFYTKK